MGNLIKVGIGEFKICKAPDTIATIGLGSCVGVVLYDADKKIAGLVHIMLPDSTKINDKTKLAKFADTGVALLVEELYKLGIRREHLKAKIAGGAKMFSFSGNTSFGNVGEKNILAVKTMLNKYDIPILAEDIGLNYGRTIVFNPDNCKLLVKSAGNTTIYL